MFRSLFSFLLAALPVAPVAHAAPPDKGLGINIHTVSYWAPTLPFTDMFKQAGNWVPQRAGSQAWNTGEALDIDADGWIRTLTPGQQAATVVMTGGRYPAGRYLVAYEGEGELFFGLDGKIVSKRGKDLLVEVTPKNSVILKIMKTNPANPIRDIRMYPPGFNPAKCNTPFNREYLDYLDGFKVIRFMDWANTNLDDTVDWFDRTRPQHATQSRNSGVAVEHMIELAEETGAHPWFNLPHAASDKYVREMAWLLKEKLAPDGKFYIEYSNEVWNTQFPQYAHMVKSAARLGISNPDDYYVRRSVEIFRIFEEVFGDTSRFVRVLGGQAVHTWRAGKLLANPNISRSVDAYAIAPYFGHQAQLDTTGALNTKNTSTEEFMRRLDKSLVETREVIRANQALAKKAGVALIAYEAGQHVTNPPGNDEFCASLNRHQKMGELYSKYLDIWDQETASALMVVFADMSNYGRSGCWGLSEYYGQDLSAAPKLQSIRRYQTQKKRAVMPSRTRRLHCTS